MNKNILYRYYRSSYRFTSTLLSAIKMKNHHYLVTESSDASKTLMKIYADKDLSTEVAVFILRKPHTWILLRQSNVTVETTISFTPFPNESEEGAQ